MLIASKWSVETRLLLAILALAFVVRVAAGVLLPSTFNADEIQQAREPAYSVAVGNTLRFWEGRNWIWPGLNLAVVWPAAQLFGPGPAVHAAVVILCALISVIGVWAAFALGRRVSLLHAVCAAGCVALWHEMIFFGYRAFSELPATSFLLLGVYLADRPKQFRNFLLMGLALGLASIFRMHIAPAAAVVALWGLWRAKPAYWIATILGGLVPVIAAGLVDWATWGAPFQSYVTNFTFNILQDGASGFGTDPPTQFVRELVQRGGAFFVVMVALALAGMRRAPHAAAAFVVVVLVHSMIAHKEYRFILPGIACAVLLAGLGLADLLAVLARGLRMKRRLVGAAGLAIFAGASVSGAASSQILTGQWTNEGVLYKTYWATHAHNFCGIGLRGFNYIGSPGLSQLPRGSIVYSDDATEARMTSAYNGLIMLGRTTWSIEKAISVESYPSVPEGYEEQVCFKAGRERACLYKRPGGCASGFPGWR